MRAEEALEVGGGADMRGQAVSHWRKKGGGVLGRGEEMGREREVGRREKKKKERGRRAAGLGRDEGVKGLGFCLFFLNLFRTFSNSHFKLLKLNSFQNTPRFSKHFFKSFKTSHKQIIKPCIQNMMHKHLLLLNY
jgi:hypothetical protein